MLRGKLIVLILGLFVGIMPLSCSNTRTIADWTPGTRVYNDNLAFYHLHTRAFELSLIADRMESDLRAGRWGPPPKQQARALEACRSARDLLLECEQAFPGFQLWNEPDPASLQDEFANRAVQLRRFVSEGRRDQFVQKADLVRQALIDALRGDSGPQ